MADVTSSIGSGGDYSTIQAWETAKQGDLVTATERQIGEGKSEEFSEKVIIEGSTTNATYYMWLRAVSGGEFDHTAGTGFRNVLTGQTATTLMLHVKDTFTRIGGSEGASSGALGIKAVTTTGTTIGIEYRNAGSTTTTSVTVYQCSSVVNTLGFFGDGTSTDNELKNCLAYDLTTTASGDTIGFRSANADDLICTNCVAHNMDATGADDAHGFSGGLVRNCYAGGIAAFDVSEAFAASPAFKAGSDYNVADDTTSSVFTNNLQSKAAADQFVSITGGSEDYHLKSGADCIDAGNDAYGNEFDIDGSFTGTRDDIGIHEFVGGLTLVQIIGDGVDLVDSSEEIIGAVKIIDDGVDLADSNLDLLSIVRVIDDGVDLADSSEEIIGAVKVIDDGVGLVESILAIVAIAALNEIIEILDEGVDLAEGTVQHRDMVKLGEPRDENVNIVEGVIAARVLVKMIDDGTEIVEPVPLLLKEWIQSSDDVVDIVETTLHAKEIVLVVDDNVDLVETIFENLGLIVVVDDGVDLVEGALALVTIIAPAITDGVDIGETENHLRVQVRVLNEGVNVSESELHGRSQVRVLDDGVDLVEGTVDSLSPSITIDEGLTVAEIVVAAVGLKVVIDDDVDIGEAATGVVQLTEMVDDGVDIGEVVVRLVTVVAPAIADGVDIDETENHLRVQVRVLNEGVSVGETAPRVGALTLVLSEGVVIAEVLVQTEAITRVLEDGVTVSDEAIAAAQKGSISSDGVEMAEVVSCFLTAIAAPINDGLTIAEGVLNGRVLVRVFTEGVKLTETALEGLTMIRLVADGVEIIETFDRFAEPGGDIELFELDSKLSVQLIEHEVINSFELDMVTAMEKSLNV